MSQSDPNDDPPEEPLPLGPMPDYGVPRRSPPFPWHLVFHLAGGSLFGLVASLLIASHFQPMDTEGFLLLQYLCGAFIVLTIAPFVATLWIFLNLFSRRLRPNAVLITWWISIAAAAGAVLALQVLDEEKYPRLANCLPFVFIILPSACAALLTVTQSPIVPLRGSSAKIDGPQSRSN